MKNIFYKIRPIDDKAYCVLEPENLEEQIKDWLDGMDVGEELVISKVEMAQEKFNDLPEYEG